MYKRPNQNIASMPQTETRGTAVVVCTPGTGVDSSRRDIRFTYVGASTPQRRLTLPAVALHLLAVSTTARGLGCYRSNVLRGTFVNDTIPHHTPRLPRVNDGCDRNQEAHACIGAELHLGSASCRCVGASPLLRLTRSPLRSARAKCRSKIFYVLLCLRFLASLLSSWVHSAGR